MSGAGPPSGLPLMPYDPAQPQQQAQSGPDGFTAAMGSMLPPQHVAAASSSSSGYSMPMPQWDGNMQAFSAASQMPSDPALMTSGPMPFPPMQQPFSMANVDALSAIHAPIDFGDLMGSGGGPGGVGGPYGQQQQHQPTLGGVAGYSIASSDADSSALPTPLPMSVGPSGASTPSGITAGATDGKHAVAKASKPKAKSKAKAKAEAGGGQEGEAGAVTTTGEDGSSGGKKKAKQPKAPKESSGEAKAPKQPKARKRKADDEGEGRRDGAEGSSRGGRASGRGGAGGKSGRGGGGGASRRPSQAAVSAMSGEGIDASASVGDTTGEGRSVVKEEPGAGSDSVLTSRAGSVAPATGTGESTPTKRGGRGGGGRGRGGRGAAARRSTAGRPGSRASRATSGRMTASVAPTGGQENGTVAPDDGAGGVGGEAVDGEEYDEAPGGAADDDDDDNADLGLEEDELDRQEAIQRQRSINMAPLMKAMTPEQQDRYAAFRRHYLNKPFVRRLVHHLTRQVVTPQVTTLVAGVGKVFIGEIVERARRIHQDTGSTSPTLRPEHLIEALREYREEREVPGRYAPGAPSAGAGVGANGKTRRLF